MIYKVFYQESKVSPRREQTHSLYMEVEAESELQGRIIARELVEKKIPTIQYRIHRTSIRKAPPI